MPLGDDFDGAVGHFYGGLIVNRVRRHWYIGGSSFCVGQGILRESLVIQVHKLRKINQPQANIVTGGQIKAAVGLSSEVGGHHRTPGAHPHVDRLVPQRRQRGLPVRTAASSRGSAIEVNAKADSHPITSTKSAQSRQDLLTDPFGADP